MRPSDFIRAARVPETLEPQKHGLWTIRRQFFDADAVRIIGFRSITVLQHISMKTIHLEGHDGDVVMEDSFTELSRHLPIWMAAHGRVLITGLGLGCVVRGLLASPDVEHVDVVEIDRWIIDTIGAEFTADPRVAIHHGDALKLKLDGRWDFAWHDLWRDDDQLQLDHANLLLDYGHRVGRQGAWAFPRQFARLMGKRLLGAPRYRRAA